MTTRNLPLGLARTAILFLAVVLGMPAHAGQIQNVTVSAVSAEYVNLNTSNPDRRDAKNVVGTVGLFGDVHTIMPGGTMWLATPPNGSPGSGSANPATNFIVFDLGAVHTVDAMKVWNYNEGNAAGTSTATNQGVKLANISYSADGANFTTNLPNQSFNSGPGTFSSFAQTIPMGGVSARYVRIDMITNWSTTANKPVGLAKVRFIDNSVPPTLVSASQNYGSNQVTVVFSESVDPASATNTANYSIQSGGKSAAILSAAMGQFNDRVVLQTSLLTNQNYTLSASGVFDQAHVITIANNSTVPVNPELVLWLRADAGVTTDGSGNVTQWNDQSGYGHNAVNTLAVNQYSAPPTLAPGAANGMPAVNFNGTQLMNIPHDANLALNGDMTLCLVFNKSSSALGDPISKTGGQSAAYTGTPVHGYTNNMPAPFDFQLNASQKPVFVWGNGAVGGGLSSLTGPAVTFGQFYIVSMVVKGTNLSCYLNGSFAASALALTAPADAGNPIMLGVRADSGNVGDAGAVFNGNLAEAIIIRGTTTPTDLVAMHNYLGPKYGIQIKGLSIDEQPQSVTAQVGKKATFWVVANGVPPLTYQWKLNGANISGATSSIYTTGALTTAANNGSYTVTVNSPVGSTNSTAATLTVVADTTAPTIFSATKTTNATTIVVAYSEAVGLNATNPASYTLNGGATVVTAAYANASSNQVVLTTTALDPAVAYYLTVQNVQDLFTSTLVPATVPVLPANLALYLRADSGVVLDSAGLVDQWLDQTTNGNNTVQFAGGPSARPTPGASAINGRPVLNFNSSAGNYLQAASAPSLALTGDMSVVAVANFTDYSTPREILGKTLLNQPASYDYYVSSPTDFRLYRGNGTASAVGRATAAPSTGVPHVIGVTMASTNVAHYLDGLANGTGTASTTMADGGTALRIGARDDLAQFMNGDFAEIMLFSSALSANDRVAIDNYLGVKYFPFAITQQPVDVTTPQGVTATFSVVANQGSAHFTYQWRKNSANIVGATNASYITPILAPSDNGESFDVAIIVPGLSTNYSSVARLTVNVAPPAIASAGIPLWSRTSIVLLYSEVVDPVTATTASNYSLDNGATVLAAAMGDTPNKVVLTTSALSAGTAYTLTVQNVKDPYNNTIVTAAVPVGVYPASTALWLKADAGITADGSGSVSEWDDQSGNANNLSGQPGTQPLLVSSGLNARPVVRFDGATSYMYANSSPSLAITGDMSIFAVVTFSNLTSSGSAGMLVSKTAQNLPAPYDYYARSTAVQFYRGNGTASGLSQATAVPSPLVPHVMGVMMQGTAVSHRLDGNANGNGTIAASIGDTGEPLFIGSREDYANHLNGDLAELIVLSSGLSSNDVASLESYLGAKYNFPIGAQFAPRITQQPVASTNVNQNSTVIVTAAATGNPAVAYQWYDINNLPVAGQTNASLVISNIQTSGAYHLNVANVFGSTNSTVVAINVFSGPPQVSLAPANLALYAGRTYTYVVNALGSAPLSYQWRKNGTAIPGATNPTYTLTVPAGTNAFSCSVSNNLSVVSSSTVTLVGLSAPATAYATAVLGNNPVAYWRLGETNGSTVALDFVGGHSCLYNNTQLGQTGYEPFEADTAAGFGILLASNSYAGEIDNSASGVPNIDFAQPVGGNAALSVEAWVNSSAAQTSGAAIVAKGYGSGGEQFDLDMGSSGNFRFFIREAGGTTHSVSSSVVPTIGQWYHLVGVWDGANGAVRLYVNGVTSGQVTNLATGLGLKATSTTNSLLPTTPLVSIGARASTQASTAYDFQFKGLIDEVALYNSALSADQVAAHYQMAVTPPRELLSISNLGSGRLQLNWSFGTLQTSPNVSGPYSDVPSASAPYVIQTTNAHQFYRVREN
jgi:hypothetical protein